MEDGLSASPLTTSGASSNWRQWGQWLLVNLGLVYALTVLVRLNKMIMFGDLALGTGFFLASCLCVAACNVLLARRGPFGWRIAFLATALLTLLSGIWMGVLGILPVVFNLPFILRTIGLF